MKSVDEQLAILGRGVVPQVWADMKDPLAQKLRLGRPLRIKCGFDPTSPDLHLGHTVVMQKMSQFQKLGHQVTFLVGDFTAMIGDPSGKNQTRPPLSRETVASNSETYKAQVFKILDPAKTQISRNSDWLAKLTAEEVIRLAARFTVARMLERNDFRQRYAGGQAIAVHEFLYPLMQAYDSVVLKTDVELGGNDQLFNLMVGRDIMREFGLEPQVILTTALLIGTDGRLEDGALVGEKMSQSLDNYVGVDDPPSGENGIYGKVMSISDPLMWHYYELLSEVDSRELEQRRQWHPKRAKQALAHEICARYRGEQAAREAAKEFERLHPTAGADRGLPEEIETISLPVAEPTLFLSRALVKAGLAASNGAARRLIAQGGVEIDGERVSDQSTTIATGGSYLVKVGKRRFRRLVLRESRQS